ncbi:unnamed protein product, partial [Dicrocoelium dendriticum]
MDTMLAGVSGAAAYLDDIILMGRTAEELFQRLAEVLVPIQSYGFRIREDKCTFLHQPSSFSVSSSQKTVVALIQKISELFKRCPHLWTCSRCVHSV